MNELAWLPEAFTPVSLVVSGVLALIVMLLWFFMYRSSQRASEQIALLEELIDLQKRQNSLLRRLCDANEPEASSQKPASAGQESDGDFVRMVAER